MSLLPSVERELMRVARAPAGGAAARPGRPKPGRPRLSGAMLAVAGALVALMVGAGFLIVLRGPGAGGGAPATVRTTPAPPTGRAVFPGAPRSQSSHVGRRGFVCRRARRNRYLPREVGCVTVLFIRGVPGDRFDLALLYARLGRRVRGGFMPGRFTLELVRPSGSVTRLRLPVTDAPPSFARSGNLDGIPGQELTLHLDDVSSGDIYGFVTFGAGRPVLIHPLLSAGGDSAAKEGFSCRVAAGQRPVVISRAMILLGPTIDGRWRWSVRTYVFHGARLFAIGHRTFVRRGLPGRRDTSAGAGCGRTIGTAAG